MYLNVCTTASFTIDDLYDYLVNSEIDYPTDNSALDFTDNSDLDSKADKLCIDFIDALSDGELYINEKETKKYKEYRRIKSYIKSYLYLRKNNSDIYKRLKQKYKWKCNW